MRPWFVGVCTSALWGYASIQYGLMHPCFTGLCTRTARTYAPVFYGVTASGFAQRLVFTALRGCRHEPVGLVFGDDKRSSDSRSRFRNKEDALRRALSRGTDMARFRSSCNVSYVRPTNRAFARFVLGGMFITGRTDIFKTSFIRLPLVCPFQESDESPILARGIVHCGKTSIFICNS